MVFFFTSLLHSDIVTYQHERKLGTVIEVYQTVDIKFTTGEVMKGISSRDLIKVHPFTDEIYVIGHGWIGRAMDTHCDVTVQLNDGSICVFSCPSREELIPEGCEFDEYVDLYEYYPSEVTFLKIEITPQILKFFFDLKES